MNCVGDTFQSKNVPTILFEAGHYKNDYQREKTRELIYIAYIESLNYISLSDVTGKKHESYFKIPENEKCFLDVIIRNTAIKGRYMDVGIQYQEKLIKGVIEFIPKVVKIEQLKGFFAHKEIDAQGVEVLNSKGAILEIDSENVFVILNNEKILL